MPTLKPTKPAILRVADHTQASQSEGLAGAPSALDLPLHADVRLLVECGGDDFSALTRQRIRRGSFHSIVSLQAAINRYLDERNARPTPFVWTASTASILAKLDRLPVPSE